ncbi:MAG: hypothetical protein HS119_09275 [Flavobacteriales bacterium]|nr:hypothetical protein [Flavobacteriales bacterium]
MQNLKKYKTLLLVLGAVIALFLGGKDVNYWGLKDPTGEQILKKVEARKIDPEKIILTPKQENEIKELINKKPTEYSDLQQSLISTKTGKEILDEIETKSLDPRTVLLNAQQLKEIIALINVNPTIYSEKQHYLVREKTAKEILDLVGLGFKSPNLITLTPKQHQDIKVLIQANPTQYNTSQKALIPELNK